MSPTEVLNNPESSEQIPSPAEASNKPESSEQIPSPAEASNEPDSSEQISSPARASDKPKSSEPISSPAEASNKSESSENICSPAEASKSESSEPIPSLAGASNKLESSKLKIPSPVEASNNSKPSEQISSPAEASNKVESSELKIPSSAETFSGSKSAEKKMSSPVEASNKPDLSKKKNTSPAVASSSGKKTPIYLKGKAKIVKKTPTQNSLKTTKGIGSSQVNGRKKRRNRDNNESSNRREEDGKKLYPRKEDQQNITNEEHTDKSHHAQKNPGKQRSTEKRHGSDKNMKNQTNREKNDEKREKLGGLIFMCSGKTKPDCFHYRIMGVSMGKKDIVLGIKRGLKLFLYDFDLKLLYGVYKASSSGGLKLEPKAFCGAFPAQVRFDVEKDCLPLPESVFKKAIKENYDEKNKFRTELTARQVRKLTALFRPAQVHSTALAPRSPHDAKVRDREVHERVRELLPLSLRDARSRDPYANGDARSHLPVLDHERDQHVAYRDMVSARREETSHDLYLTEKEYRAFGLRGDRRNVTHFTTPALETRHREYEREHLPRQSNLIYREPVPAHRENVHSDPLYLNDKDYPAYTRGARHELPPATSATAVDVYATDPHYGYSYYGASSYLAPRTREEVPSGSYSVSGRRETYRIETDPVRRRETNGLERLYSTHDVRGRREYLTETDPLQRRETDRVERSLYSTRDAAVEAPLGYNRTENYQGTKPESFLAPVSSRYAFAGPSYSYR